MSVTLIDARGLACPQPVVLARRAMLEPGAETVTLAVSDQTSVENIGRMAASLGWQSTAAQAPDHFVLTLRKGQASAPSTNPRSREAPAPLGSKPKILVLISSSLLGTGEDELGRLLMRLFIKTLPDLDRLPDRMIFINSGVRLTCQGSDLIDDLRRLEQQGLEIVSCGTCLDYYHLKDSLRVGRVSNMFEIAQSLMDADRVLRP